MNQELQQVLHRAMKQAALAYMTACDYPQPDIDRVASVKDEELLYVCMGAGENGIEHRITISDAKYTRASTVKIVLKPNNTKSGDLIDFAKRLDTMRKESSKEVPALVETALKELLS